MASVMATAKVFPTEDPGKVRQALLNLFPGADLVEGECGMTASTTDLSHFMELVRRQRILDAMRATLLRGIEADSITFSLNKQAAFVGKISMVEGNVPLGAIIVTIQDEDLSSLIDRVAPTTSGRGGAAMIAISSPSLSLLPLREALAAVQSGFKAWEIVAEGRHYLPDIAKELEEYLASHDLDCSVHAPLSDVNIGSLNPRLREVALREVVVTIEQAGALGLNPVTVHPGFYTPIGHLDKEGVRRKTKDALHAIDKIAKDCGVKVALENMPAMPITMATDPKGLLELLEGTELGICFDIGHANTTRNIDDYLALTAQVPQRAFP